MHSDRRGRRTQTASVTMPIKTMSPDYIAGTDAFVIRQPTILLFQLASPLHFLLVLGASTDS